MLCLQDAASSASCTGSTCSSSRSLPTFFPLPGGLFSVPQSNCLSSTLETQFVLSPPDFSSTIGPRCVSCSQIVFTSMTVTQSNPLPLWYLISAYILLPSELPSFEVTCTMGHVPSLSLCLLSIYFVPGTDLRY